MGKLIVFAAPSGCGKNTIINELNKDNSYVYAISATSRNPRKGECYGNPYYFMSESEFKEKIKEDAFIEFEEVYVGQFYGTLKSEIERLLNEYKDVLLDLDVKGALNLKKTYPNECLTIFIQPPSKDELERRLRARGTESNDLIKKRLDRAEFEISFKDKFDHVVTNDDLNKAVNEIKEILKGDQS